MLLRSASAPVEPSATGDWSSTLMAGGERIEGAREPYRGRFRGPLSRRRCATERLLVGVRSPAVRRMLERWSARLALASLLVGACVCAGVIATPASPAATRTSPIAASASPAAARASAPRALLTYIVGLGTGREPQVVVSHVDGHSPRVLGRASSALLSPDGGEVAAIYSADGTLSLYAAAGGVRRVLERRNLQFMQLLAWSPDSKWLLVEIGSTPTAHLIVFNAASGASMTIATGVFDGASFDPGGSDDIVYAQAANSGASAF